MPPNSTCTLTGAGDSIAQRTEYSAAWLAQLLWEQWVGGSNPSTPSRSNWGVLAHFSSAFLFIPTPIHS